MEFLAKSALRMRAGTWISGIAALFVWLDAFAAVDASPLPEAVGFTPSPRGHILLPVSIDGSEPLIFVLDTGAGKSVVTPGLVDRLGLAAVPGESVATLGVHGKSDNAMVQLHSVAVGDARVAGIQAVVLDLNHITRGAWHADGILGMDFLRQFDLRLDFGASTVSLYAPALDRTDCRACPADATGLAFETIDPGFIVLPVQVDGKPFGAVLDTGSGHSGLNSKAAVALGVTLPPMGAGAPTGHGFGLQTGPVQIGDVSLAERATLRVMDHPVMEALGLADRATMLLGTDQLAGWALTISYSLGMLFVQ